MIRPCFLVIDRDYGASISTRKLVIETAKINVITAYSGSEGIDTLKRFPNLDGIVLDAGIEDIQCQDLIARVKELEPAIPVVVIRTPRSEHSPLADYELESFDPVRLLDLLRKLAPQRTREAQETDEKFAEKEMLEAKAGKQSKNQS